MAEESEFADAQWVLVDGVGEVQVDGRGLPILKDDEYRWDLYETKPGRQGAYSYSYGYAYSGRTTGYAALLKYAGRNWIGMAKWEKVIRRDFNRLHGKTEIAALMALSEVPGLIEVRNLDTGKSKPATPSAKRPTNGRLKPPLTPQGPKGNDLSGSMSTTDLAEAVRKLDEALKRMNRGR
jgi:hypothetical protein